MADYRKACQQAEAAALRCSSVLLEGSDVALVEDLVDGFHNSFGGIRAAVDGGNLARRISNPEGGKRFYVVRDPQNFKDYNLEVLERRRYDARLRVIFCGKVSGEVADWFEGRGSAFAASGPAQNRWGDWWATRTAARWDYSKPDGWKVDSRTAQRVMERLGGDFSAGIQAARTLRYIHPGDGKVTPEVAAYVCDTVSGSGFVDALVFGRPGRAKELVETVDPSELAFVLGKIRWHLHQLWRLRTAQMSGVGASKRLEYAKVPAWRWQSVYRPVYARYTEGSLLRKMALVAESMDAIRRGNRTALLERLVMMW